MKKIIFTLSLIIMIFSCSRNEKKQKPLLCVKAEVSDKVNIQYRHNDFEECYPVKISIKNNSDSTIRFWIMSCSWEDNFVFNSDSIRIFGLGCDKNFPKKIELPANGTLVYNNRYIKVCGWGAIQKQAILKLGFIVIRVNDFSELNHDKSFSDVLLEKKNRKRDIIWCDGSIVIQK